MAPAPGTPAAGTPTPGDPADRTPLAFTDEVRERLARDAQTIIARYPVPRSALLPMLHLVQSEQGFVSAEGIAFCAEQLDLTTAEVAAVATFYTQYKRHPNGTYTVGVCVNTLCAVMGGDAIFAELERHLGVGHDETTEDGEITLEAVECNAACDYAPVVMVNWEFFDNQTPGSARALVDRLRAGEQVTPTRGAATVCSFKEVSRVLAGFGDGRAAEGVNAGAPSREGTLLSRRSGWTAPPGPGDGGSAPVASMAAQPAARAARTSGNDAGAVPADTTERAGTVAGKPVGEATRGTDDDGSPVTPAPDGDAASETKEA